MMMPRAQMGCIHRATALSSGLLLVAAISPRAACGADGLAYENQVASISLYAPVDLEVVDSQRTSERFRAVGERLPIAVRVDAEAVEAVSAQLAGAFRRTRERFRARLEEEFGAPQVGLRDINSSRFRVVLDDFQAGNALFPVNLVLAQSWAKGYDGEPTVDRLATAVRDLLRTHHVAELRSAAEVWVVSLGPAATVRSWADVAPHVREAEVGRILDRQSAGAMLRRNLDAVDRTAAGFLTSLLRDTLVPDSYLTGLLLADRYGSHVEARRYAAGSLIVKDGETIDRWAALALESIDRRGLEPATSGVPAAVVSPVEPPQPTPLDAPRTRPPAVEVTPGLEDAPVASTNGWLVTAGAFLIVLAGLGVGGWWLRRSGLQPPQWLIPAPRQTEASMREAILPHLARELKGRLVQVLFAQRQALLDNEAEASRRVEELEARLARLQPAIAEKIRTYERRIRILEKEIEEKDQETRDLLRAKLVLARKELDEEIARNRIELN